jgi:hypothetical protein
LTTREILLVNEKVASFKEWKAGLEEKWGRKKQMDMSMRYEASVELVSIEM